MPLKVSDGIAAYISDFQKSDAPQFKGKSKKERRDMAIAAYLTAKRGGKPQEENVKSADRKPEVYTKPDGKKGVRMVPVDREVVKTEAYTMGKPIEKKKKNVGEKTYMRTDSKLKNLKVPVTRKKGKITIPGSKLATSRKEALDSNDKPFVKDLIKKLRGGSKTHAKQADDLEKAMKEETNFAVSIEGLPMMFMSADSPGMLKQTLRKIVKQPSMIKAVKRVTDAKVKKTFRLKAQGRDEEEVEENYKYDYGSPESIKLMKKVTPGQNKNEEKDPRLAAAGVKGYNKAKRTPNHPEKSHIVVAKDGDKVKTIRFGQQGVTTAGAPKKGESDKQKARRKNFKARHAKNIAKGKMSAAYWADKVKW